MEKTEHTFKWKKYNFLGIKLVLTDLILISFIIVYNLLAIVFSSKIDDWFLSVIKNTAVGIIFIFFVYLTQKTTNRLLKFLLRTGSVQFLFAYLFAAVHKFQLIFFSWNDNAVINFENSIFGVNPTVWLEKIKTPLLTEIMMFAYVIYLFIYPILAAIIYFKYGEDKFEYYLLVLGITNIACNIGFVLFPAAGPAQWDSIKGLHKIPLQGYFFTSIGEYIRANFHPVGGTIPSPHCAIGTVMMYMSYRFHRPFFFAVTPIIILLYISTIYGVYHYVTDTITGIITAIIIIVLFNYCFKKLNYENTMVKSNLR